MSLLQKFVKANRASVERKFKRDLELFFVNEKHRKQALSFFPGLTKGQIKELDIFFKKKSESDETGKETN